MFERDQVLECVSPTPGLVRGALYVCKDVVSAHPELFPRWRLVVVQEAHTGKPAGEYWEFRFKAARYQLMPDGTRQP